MMMASNTGKENMSVLQVPTSPSFLKPKPIKLRKRTLKQPALPLEAIDFDKKQLGYLTIPHKVAHNPFRCRQNANKRKRKEELGLDDSNPFLSTQINQSTLSASKILSSPVVPSMLDESALSSFSENVASTFQLLDKEEKSSQKSKILPVDWSLKTKVRFISSVPFPSRGVFRTFEEVNGTIGFVRCLHSGTMENQASGLHSSHGAKFFQHCLVWMHPTLPWLNLYPRSNSLVTKSSSSSIVLDSGAIEKLHSSWCDSLRSLYQLVRLYQCPYFYMCASKFTVLFRCAGAGSIPVLHAFVTPTSRGFRKALDEEGITYSMPFCPSKDSSKDSESGFEELQGDSTTISDSPGSDTECSNDVDPIEDDQVDSWLESLGLSQDNFPMLNKTKRNDEKSRVDHKPESLIYVEDCETQALVNFLLNSTLCTSNTGPLAGIPPTLLAPTAFLGGALQPLKIRHGRVKDGAKEMESVEVSGPLLPNAVHSLCSLLAGTQEAFTARFSTDLQTTAFSKVVPQSDAMPCLFAKNNIDDCGLPGPFLDGMCAKAEFEIATLHCQDGLFSYL